MKHEVLPLNIVSTLEQGQGNCFIASVFTPLHLRYGHDDNKMNLLHRIVAYEAHRIHESAVPVANIISFCFHHLKGIIWKKICFLWSTFCLMGWVWYRGTHCHSHMSGWNGWILWYTVYFKLLWYATWHMKTAKLLFRSKKLCCGKAKQLISTNVCFALVPVLCCVHRNLHDISYPYK